jgi:hypothetical protein
MNSASGWGRRSVGVLLLAVLAIGVAGCGGPQPIVGAVPSPGPPASSVAKYSLTGCVDAAGNPTTRFGGELTYHLEHGARGLALHEFDRAGSGAMITNHWIDERGDHFFTYVPGSFGLELVLPLDRTLAGSRLVYDKGAYQPLSDGVTVRVAGTPIVICDVTPDLPPAPPPAPTPIPVPVACATDADCGPDMVCEANLCVSVMAATAEPDAGVGPAPAVAPVPAPAAQPEPEAAPAAAPEDEGEKKKCKKKGKKKCKKKDKKKDKKKGKKGEELACGADNDCPGEQICDAGKCVDPAPPEPAKPAGCSHDMDCKGNRVCDHGKCVSP